MNPLVIPALLTAGVGGALLLSRTANPVAPAPTPTPNTQPAANAATAAQLLLQQIAQNPQAVDATQIGLLVATLKSQGQTGLAGQLEAAGVVVCAAQAKDPRCWQVPVGAPPPAGGMGAGAPAPMGPIVGPVPTRPQTPTPNPNQQQELIVLFEQVRANPPKRLTDIDTLAARLQAAGLPQQAAELTQLTGRMRSLQALGLPADDAIPNPNAGILPAAIAATVQRALTAEPDPVKVDAVKNALQAAFPGGFAQQVFALEKRAKDLRDAGR